MRQQQEQKLKEKEEVKKKIGNLRLLLSSAEVIKYGCVNKARRGCGLKALWLQEQIRLKAQNKSRYDPRRSKLLSDSSTLSSLK